MNDVLGVLRRVRDAPSAPRPRAGERCDLCHEELPDEHRHLVDLHQRMLMCSCRGCHLLFTQPGSGGGHFKAVPDRFLAFPGFKLSPSLWDALQIPVSVAFFFVNSELGRVCAFYPGPAGATESLLSLETWEEVVAANPELATLEPDVEAFLVRVSRHGGGAGAESFGVPIDACYELVGHLRRLWRGFDGGGEAHQALEDFFGRVRLRAELR